MRPTRPLAAVGIAAALLLPLTAGSCESKPNPQAIAKLCAAFNGTSHKQLLTPEAKKRVDAVRTGGGIPTGLASAAARYYEGEKLDGAQIDTFPQDRRNRLESHRLAVLAECRKNGWSN